MPNLALLSGPKYFTAPVVLPTSYSTNFDATEDPISEDGNWLGGATNGVGWSDLQTASGRCYAKSGSLVDYKDALAILNPLKFNIPVNQKVTSLVYLDSYTPPGSHELEQLLRWLCSSNYMPGYEALWTMNTNVQLIRQEGDYNPSGNFTALASDSIADMQNGDSLVSSIIASAILMKRNGSTAISHTDSTWTTGTPGVGAWLTGGGTPNRFCSTSFLAEAA